jgi:hypothetical protein
MNCMYTFSKEASHLPSFKILTWSRWRNWYLSTYIQTNCCQCRTIIYRVVLCKINSTDGQQRQDSNMTSEVLIFV